MLKEGIVSAAFVPIMSKNRFLGMMMVGSFKFHRFSELEIDLLMAFGSQIGTALQNAQLYDEVNKGKRFIENLVENAGDVIVSTDMEDRILTWNRGAELIMGYIPSDELIRRAYSEPISSSRTCPRTGGNACESPDFWRASGHRGSEQKERWSDDLFVFVGLSD